MSRTYNLDILVNVLNQAKNPFSALTTSLTKLRAQATQGSREFILLQRAINSLSDPVGGISFIEDFADAVKQAQSGLTALSNTNIGKNVPAALKQFEFLAGKLRDVLNVAQQTDNIDLFNEASDTLDIVEKLTSQFKEQVKVNRENTQELSRQKSILDAQTAGISKSVSQIKKDFQSLTEIGSVLPSQGKLTSELDGAIDKLQDIRKELIGLGKSTTSIDLKIAEAKNLRSDISNVTEAVDLLNKEKYEIKLEAGERVKNLNKDLRELQKLLDDAAKNRDLKLIATIKADTKEFEKEVDRIRAYGQASGDVDIIKRTDEVRLKADKFKKSLSDVENSIPKGVLGYFKNLGANVSETSKKLGGANSIFRVVSGGLRLAGTSAFLVGGQFRTLGFAASALGNILQTFGPLIARIVAGFGPIAPLLLGVGVAAAGAAAQIAAVSVALVSVIDTGFKFNNQFSKVQNSVAAVAREFFDFSSNSGGVSNSLDEGANSAVKFELAGAAVAKELKALQLEATRTEFTAQDLFEAFQSTTSALGNLSPSLTASRQLTGLFARTASIARVPISQLGSSISQIVAGTGRITNPLVRDVFNKLKDSQGIALTAKRIRELRAQGGTVLFDELTAALQRFTAGVGELQAERTLSGAFSNLQDLFQIFSGEATKPAYDIVIKSLVQVRDAIVSIDKLTGKVTFTAPFQKLLDLSGKFITRLGRDFASVANKIIEWAKTLGTYFENNYEYFVSLYEIAKEFISALGNLLVDMLEFLGVTKSTGLGFSFLIKLVGILTAGIQGLQISFNYVYLIVLGIGKAFSVILNLLSDTVSFFVGDTFLNNWAKRFGQSIDQNILERFNSITKGASNLKKTLSATANPEQFRKDLKTAEAQAAEDVKSTPTKSTPQEETRKTSSRANLQLLEEYRQFYEALLGLSNTYNDLILERVRKRVEREQAIISAQVDLGLTTQIAAEEKIKNLRLGFIDTQIARIKQQQLEEDLRNKNNLRNSEQQKKIIREVQSSEQEATDAKLRADKEAINSIGTITQAETKRIELNERLRDLAYERLNIELESLKAQAQATASLRKESLELSAAVASLQYPDSFIALNKQFKVEIREASAEYLRLTQQIANLQNTQKQSELEQLQLSKEKLDGLKLQLALSQQQATFNQLQNTASRELNRLSIEQANIQREVEFGRISAEDGIERTTKLNYEYGKALEIVLEQLKAVAKENPTEAQRAQIFELEQRITSLKDGLTDSDLLSASNSIRDNLVDVFVSIQENAGGAADAIKSFASSILGTFRRLLAEKIVRDFFDKFFPASGQTSGKATGFLPEFFRSIGLGAATGIRGRVENAPRNPELESRIKSEVEQASTFKTVQERISNIDSQLNEEKDKLLKILQPVSSKLDELGKAAAEGASKLSLTQVDFKTQVEKLLEPLKPQLTDAFKNLTDDIRTQLNTYLSEVLGISVPSTGKGGATVSGSKFQGIGSRQVGGSVGVGRGGSKSSVGIGTGGRAAAASESTAKAEEQVAGISGTGIPLGVESFDTVPKAPENLSFLDRILLAKDVEGPYGSQLVGRLANFFTGREAPIPTRQQQLTPEQREAAIKARQGVQGLPTFLPATAFASLTDKQLLTFNIEDRKDEFKRAVDQRLNQEYNEYNKIQRGADGLLGFFGITGGSGGNLTRTPIPVIARYTADTILARSKNNISEAANLATQIIADVTKATELSNELKTISDQITEATNTIKTQEEGLKAGLYPGQENAYKSSIQSNKSALEGFNKKSAEKYKLLKPIIDRLSNFGYSSKIFTPVNPLSDTFKLNPVRRAAGGAVFGKGGPTEDSIPAMLSNGEYVVNAKSVSKLGVPFFDRLNNVNSYADGGKLIDTLYSNPAYRAPAIDAAKFNYFGGAASLINRPAAIVEAAAKKVEPQKRKKRGIFGSILSFIAPFLSAIPVVGPLLSLGVGAAGGALSGSEKGVLGGILGGIFGGLSNLGGFSGSKGFMGNLSKFFGEGGKGAPFLSLLGMSGAGNLGNTLGQGLFGLSSQIFSKTPTNMINMFDRNSARDIISSGVNRGIGYDPSKIGSILSKVGLKGFKFAGGGFLGNLSPILGGLFGGSGGPLGFLSPLLGGSKGGGANLLGMFAPILMSMLGVGGGMFGMLIPLLMSLFGSKGLGKNLGLPATGAIAMATGGIVPAGPTPNPLTSAISSIIASSGNIPNTKRRGLLGNIGTLMSSAVKLSESLSSVKLPTIDKILTKQGFGVLATKGGWKIGLGKALKFANGGTVNFPFGKNLTMSQIFPQSGSSNNSGSGIGSLLNLGLTLGSMFLPSLLNKQPKQPDYSITDPDYARKNRFGSAYDSLVEYGVIGEYRYQKETLEALRRGSKWMPIQRQSGNAGSLLNMILPFVFSSASGLLPKKKARGGMITGPGTGTSDSIPAWLSSGEYVIKASAVRSLGTDILDSINEGRFKFAKGGLAGDGVNTLPEIDFSAQNSSENPVTVNSNTKIVNVLDPSLVGDYLQTNEGTKVLVNLISRRSREIKAIINR